MTLILLFEISSNFDFQKCSEYHYFVIWCFEEKLQPQKGKD